MKMSVLTKALPAALMAFSFLAPVAHAQQSGGMDMKGMMAKSNQKMMSMPMTGKPDVDFAMMMREHHMSAVRMAEWQLQNGKHQKMKQLAQKIIADQKKEIGQFDQFLAQNGHKAGGSMGASGSGAKPSAESHSHSK